jgi:hypothetical protein
MTDSFSIYLPLSKVEEQPDGTLMVWGRATQEVRDSAGEIMDYESSAPLFRRRSQETMDRSDGQNAFPLRAMHQPIAAGKVIEFQFNDEDKAIDICFKIVDENEIKKVREHVYTGLSVGGRYARRWPDNDGRSMRYTADPHEISLVDIPSVPTAKLTLFKIDSMDEMGKGDFEGHPFRSNQYTNGGAANHVDTNALKPGVVEAQVNMAIKPTQVVQTKDVQIAKSDSLSDTAPAWVIEFNESVKALAGLQKAQQEERARQENKLLKISERVGIARRESSPLSAPNEYPQDFAEYGDPANFAFPMDEAHVSGNVARFNKGTGTEVYSLRERHILGRRLASLASRFGASYQYDPQLRKISRKELTPMSDQDLTKIDVGKLVAQLKAARDTAASMIANDPAAVKDAMSMLMGHLDSLDPSSPVGSGTTAPVSDPSTVIKAAAKTDSSPSSTPESTTTTTPESAPTKATPVAKEKKPAESETESTPESTETSTPTTEAYKKDMDAVNKKVDAIADAVNKLADAISKSAVKPAPVQSDDSPIGALNALVNKRADDLGLEETEQKIIKALEEGGPYALIKALKIAGSDDEVGGALAWQTMNNAIRKATYNDLEKGGVVTSKAYPRRLYQAPN